MRAWLATMADGDGSGQAAAVGLVSLVAVPGLGAARYSLGWLVVDPAFRRRGLGRTLVARAVREAALLGASMVHVETLDRWPAAAAFWEAVR